MKPDWLNRLIGQDNTSLAEQPFAEPLQACQPEHPCGEDVGNNELFLQVKENLALLSGLDSIALERDCLVLLQQGKDLRPAVYLVYAWIRQQGWQGLLQGLQFLEALIRLYGNKLHPRRNETRHATLAWLGSSKVLDWLDAQGSPPAPLKPALRQQLQAVLEAWAGHDARLQTAWSALQARLQQEDAQESVARDAAMPDGLLQHTPYQDQAIRSSQMLMDSLRAMCSYLRQQPHGAFAAFRLARVVRWDSVLHPPPHNGQLLTRLAGPRPELRQQLKRLLLQKQWHGLLEKIDAAFLESANHFWLDLQYMAWQALGQLGQDYQQWRDIALSDIALMRHRLPDIEQLRFADGSSFADDTTLEWLASHAVVHDISAGEAITPTYANAGSDPSLQDISQEARLLAEQQGLETALAWLQTLPQPRGMRGQTERLLLTARLAEANGRADIALGIASGLESQVCSPAICQWDPELAFEVKLTYQQLLRSRGRKENDKQQLNLQLQRLQQELSLLNPLRSALLPSY
ncbi:type VI secretion system protein TssA [Aquitalea sp. ASV15]|uniref:type VI secretion system protein TssA n=1 Tax=Aquitalea sp. ASV15 TaxID=2795104 RepID=UPI0018EAFCC6|nr:type VI secretion system protein TssA [Aquitalea sp. ASV15]